MLRGHVPTSPEHRNGRCPMACWNIRAVAGIRGVLTRPGAATVWLCPPHGRWTAGMGGKICSDEPHVPQGYGAWRLGILTGL